MHRLRGLWVALHNIIEASIPASRERYSHAQAGILAHQVQRVKHYFISYQIFSDFSKNITLEWFFQKVHALKAYLKVAQWVCMSWFFCVCAHNTFFDFYHVDKLEFFSCSAFVNAYVLAMSCGVGVGCG